MTLKWGSTTVTAVKWGSTTCTAVYWGSTLVFPEGFLGYLTDAWIMYVISGSYNQKNTTSYTNGSRYATVDVANRKGTCKTASNYQMDVALITSKAVSISGTVSVTVTTNANNSSYQPRFIYGTAKPNTVNSGSLSNTIETTHKASSSSNALTNNTAKSFSLSGNYYIGVALRVLYGGEYYATITAMK